MFTGLIKSLGKIEKIEKLGNSLKFEILHQFLNEKIAIDDSIAVDGVCLTVISYTDNTFSAIAIEETLRKTTLQNFNINQIVNLELALTITDRLGGHNVQGHVDERAKLIKIEEDSIGKNLYFEFSPEFSNLVVERGSITINGISLTVANRNQNILKVSIIPHTWQKTNLSFLQVNDEVNIEYDIFGKYVLQYIQPYLNQMKAE